MAAIRHVGFLKILTVDGYESEHASSCQISWRSVKPLLRYGKVAIFQDGGCSPSWISYAGGLDHLHWVVITVQNLVGIDAVVSIICKLLYFAS